MSSPDPAAAAAQQRAAARLLIEQLVANSDVHGEDEMEQQRVSGVSDEVRAAAAARQAALQRRQEEQYPDGLASSSEAAAASSAFPPAHVDEVHHALANGGVIPPDMLAAWQEMFGLFDADASGFIPTEELGTVLRGLGRNVTEETVGELVNRYDRTGAGRIDFQTFHALLCENSPAMPGPCHAEQVVRDFACFDIYREGTIPVHELVHLLRNMGEPLTRDDVDHLLQEIYIDGDNKVNIKDLVQHMFRTSAPNPE